MDANKSRCKQSGTATSGTLGGLYETHHGALLVAAQSGGNWARALGFAFEKFINIKESQAKNKK